MANTKEIQARISSIHDTMKITKAMYMMSSVKLRKAKQKLENTEPYFYGLQDQIRSILFHFPTMQHLFFDNRNVDIHESVKKKAFIVISGDKGMAGAYNHNVLKEAKRLCDEAEQYKIFAIGETGRADMMTPTKSVTAVIGLTTGEVSSKKKGCMSCNLKGTCRFREAGGHCNE